MTAPTSTGSATSGYTAPVADSALLLTYYVDPVTVLFETKPENPSIATISLEIQNLQSAPVTCDAILIALPIGDTAATLSRAGTDVSVTSLQRSWTAVARPDGVVELRPCRPGDGTVRAGSEIAFSITFSVNGKAGFALLAVTEQCAGETRTGHVQIQKISPARSLSFTAAPAHLAKIGDVVSLSWDAPMTSHCELSMTLLPNGPTISEEDDLPISFTRDIHVTQSMLFTLVATGHGPELTVQRTVIVPAPAVTELTVTPQDSSPPTVQIQWKTSNATGVRIEPGFEGPLKPADAQLVPWGFWRNRVYQVTPFADSVGIDGKAETVFGPPKSCTVQPPAPRIDEFVQVPNPAAPSPLPYLRWGASFSYLCRLSSHGDTIFNPTAGASVDLPADATDELGAIGPNGRAAKQVVIRRPGLKDVGARFPAPLWDDRLSVYSNTPLGLVVSQERAADALMERFSTTGDLKSWSKVPPETQLKRAPLGAGTAWAKDKFWRLGTFEGSGIGSQVWAAADAINWEWQANNAPWGDRSVQGWVAALGDLIYILDGPSGTLWSMPSPGVWNVERTVSPFWLQQDQPTAKKTAMRARPMSLVCHADGIWAVAAAADGGMACQRVAPTIGPVIRAPSATPRGSPVLQSVGDYMYMIGGSKVGEYTRTNQFGDIWRIDRAGNWSMCPSKLPAAVVGGGQIDGRIVLIRQDLTLMTYVPE